VGLVVVEANMVDYDLIYVILLVLRQRKGEEALMKIYQEYIERCKKHINYYRFKKAIEYMSSKDLVEVRKIVEPITVKRDGKRFSRMEEITKIRITEKGERYIDEMKKLKEILAEKICEC
jgi:predicted transcriptional regulator